METLLQIALAIAALAVPVCCAYLIVRRLARRHPAQTITGTGRNGRH